MTSSLARIGGAWRRLPRSQTGDPPRILKPKRRKTKDPYRNSFGTSFLHKIPLIGRFHIADPSWLVVSFLLIRLDSVSWISSSELVGKSWLRKFLAVLYLYYPLSFVVWFLSPSLVVSSTFFSSIWFVFVLYPYRWLLILLSANHFRLVCYKILLQPL